MGTGAPATIAAAFAAASVVLTTSLVSIVIVPVLVAGAIALVLAGALVVGAGLLSLVVPSVVHLRGLVVLGTVDLDTQLGRALAVILGVVAVGISLLA